MNATTATEIADPPKWAAEANCWDKLPNGDQDYFFYGPDVSTSLGEGGKATIVMQRNELRGPDDQPIETIDSIDLTVTGGTALLTTDARKVAHDLVVASRTLEDETAVWQPTGDWAVDGVDGSRFRFTDGLAFTVAGHDGEFSARMEKWEHQPGTQDEEAQTTYLIATGPDVAFTADQARQIADELIRYAALLDEAEENDR